MPRTACLVRHARCGMPRAGAVCHLVNQRAKLTVLILQFVYHIVHVAAQVLPVSESMQAGGGQRHASRTASTHHQ